MLEDIIEREMETIQNGFPMEIYPQVIQELLRNVVSAKSFNKDFLSVGVLSACATAIGKTIRIDHDVWEDKPILWIAIIGRSGTGKSHALEYAIRPLKDKDEEYYQQYKDEFKIYKENKENKDGDKPNFVHYIMDDFTPEKLAENLQFNKKGILVFKDELMGWVNSFDQYSKGGEQERYLELFNGGGLTVERVTKETIKVPNVNVNILGGIQPHKLKNLAGNDRMEDGFLNRFLFVNPENLQPNLYSGIVPDKSLDEDYSKWINNLLEAKEMVIQVGNECKTIYKNWQHPNVESHFDDQVENAIQAKLETYVWRFALVIEMMEQAVSNNFKNELSVLSMKKAIKLAEYFRKNAISVHNRLMGLNPLKDLPEKKIALYKELPLKFSRGEALEIFEKHKVRGGSVARFLKKRSLFKKEKHGFYCKIAHINTW